MESLRYRKARTEDMEAVMALQTAVFHGEQLIPRDAVEAFLAMEPQCWVAELDGVIVGTAAAWHEGGQLHWGRFIVTKALRGRHIGTKLAAFTFAELFSQGIDSIFMEARDTTVAIVGKMGGTVAGEPVPFYKGTVTPVWITRAAFARCSQEMQNGCSS